MSGRYACDHSLADCGEEASCDEVGRRPWVAAVTIGSQPLVELVDDASALCRIERHARKIVQTALRAS